jgi:tight adherence protein C
MASLLYIGLMALAAAVPLVALGLSRSRAAHALERDTVRYLGEEGFVQGEEVPPSPTTRFFAAIGRRVTPAGYLETLRDRLAKAGRPISPERHVAAKAIGGSAGILLGLWTASSRPLVGLVLAGVGGAFGFFYPDRALRRRVEHREDAMRRDLPESLDLMAISVEAGASLEGAMARAAQDIGGALSEEFRRLLREMQLGGSRREAFQALRKRVDLPEMTGFVMAVLQADALGIAIARVLKTQAVEMRRKRRQRAKEQAAKTPVKILFPLVFGIFPAMLIVVLGPAAIRILGTLSNAL